jgi:hypothetical protein
MFTSVNMKMAVTCSSCGTTHTLLGLLVLCTQCNPEDNVVLDLWSVDMCQAFSHYLTHLLYLYSLVIVLLLLVFRFTLP